MFENGQLTVLNMADILPNRFQPRIKFDEEKLEELAESIAKYGVIQPIVVRPVNNKYEIIAGERRFKASKLANKSTIPVIVVNLSDKDSEEIALLENIQRQALSPIEEAVSYKRILDMGYITQEELAKKIGKAQSTIANKIRLLNLDDEVQSYLLNNKISERHARSLLRISDKEKQVEMLHRIVNERLTVKQTDKEIEKLRSQTNIENKPAKPITLNISQSETPRNNQTSESISEEIENLFNEKEINNEERGSGTMDIDKIMREAKDINIPQEQPRDISGLMQPSNDVQSEPIVSEEPQVNIESNKFINVTPQEPQTKAPETPVNNVVTFDSMFNQHINTDETTLAKPDLTKVEPVNQTQTNLAQPVEPVAEVNISNVSAADDYTVPDDTKKIISTAVADALSRYRSKKSTKSENVPPAQDVAMPVQPQVSSLQNVEMQSPSVSLDSSQMQPVNNSFMEQSISQPVQSTSPLETPILNNVESASMQTYNDVNMNIASGNVMPTVATSLPVENNIVINPESIPSTDIIGDIGVSNLSDQSTMASAIPQDVKPVNMKANFAQIVQMLRDCADNIEKNGYFVAVDELDLGGQYKVTFTINKE